MIYYNNKKIKNKKTSNFFFLFFEVYVYLVYVLNPFIVMCMKTCIGEEDHFF